MMDLFGGALPKQEHPSARITWCGYPAPEGEHPAQNCLSWMVGSVDEPADCLECVHCTATRIERAAKGGGDE
jgi:hypothetical protein